MAHTDTWDEFLAKLDNSPRGRMEAGIGGLCDAITRPVFTNPQTYADIAEQNLKASRTAVRCGEAVQFINFNKED